MKTILRAILVLVQVLVCTMGQGALTICIRNDGTQQLEWAWSNSCTHSETEGICHCGCGAEEYPDEIPSGVPDSSGMGRTCSCCTDYLLVAEQPSVTVEKNQNLTNDQRSFLFGSI